MEIAYDVDLHDTELEDEIRLLSELMVTASGATDTLDVGTVDALLGVDQTTGVPRQRRAG